ncbi:uncharacterized protein LOC126896747 isoform X2 [Daktulosphaira vitifoliae]|uniref:uncharacterized protein LOC126896747 isoform X2 n=1 Tax=Daktulosphaira vitifoliae TaxID=58002 RepID=UPI0021AA2EAA|nr:uncharacterized protein LOC126896747 isoform X2 [Daktulosphaira vitifoliae]
MILNPILFIITVMVIFRSMQVNTCCIKSVPRYDFKYETALSLDTGFIYPEHEESNNLDITTIKKLLNINILPQEETIKKPIDLIYCDLICGNMYVFKNYLWISRNLIDNNLEESITGRMLVSLFKINKLTYEKPFWEAHMYIIYSSMFRNETNENHKAFISTVNYLTRDSLQRHINTWCRENNQYKTIVQHNNESTEIQNIIKLINERQAKNDILLENKIEINWVSLKSIYLHQILEDEHFWKTIIVTFGDQNEVVYKAIRDNIFNNYELAKNYYYYDNWVMQIAKYLESMFNIIRIVTLHLIRNYLYYAENYRKLNPSLLREVDVGYSKIKEILLKNNFFIQLFNKSYYNNVITILEKLNERQKINNKINETHIATVVKIDIIMKTLSSKFELIPLDTLLNNVYLDLKKNENEKNRKFITMEDSNKEKTFQNKFDCQLLRDSYSSIIMYLRYVETKFETYNIAFSFIRAFKNYGKISYYIIKQGKKLYYNRTNSEKLIQF